MWQSEQQLTEIIINVVLVTIETYNHNRRQSQLNSTISRMQPPYPTQCNSNETQK